MADDMVVAIKQTVTVQPGGVIEVRSPDLQEGTAAEVIILIQGPTPARRPLASFIGSGRGLFKDADEVDSYVRGLRDEWDR